MTSSEQELTQAFQSCCEYYFKQKFQQNRFLYFDKIPHNYFGTDYKVEITSSDYSWKDKPEIIYTIHKIEDSEYGKQKCEIRQSCLVSYFFKVNNLLEMGRETKTINFYCESIEPFGATFSVKIIADEIIVMDRYREIKQNLKRKFEIKNINEENYPNDSIGFGFFAEILRKKRNLVSINNNISHGYFYYEIAHCHGEVEVCLITALLNQKYSSDLLRRKVDFEGKELFLPNLNYNDLQYLTMVGFGFERLYSFWDRIAYLLYNFETLDFKRASHVSFDKYFLEMEKLLAANRPSIFNSNSMNLNWLIDFHKNEFKRITDYRHRIVHYQMTSNWDGVLSSKFANNASQYTSDLNELTRIKLEFDGLGFLLKEQFNFCKEGFLAALNLIDELS